jgi:hypothetical protein
MPDSPRDFGIDLEFIPLRMRLPDGVRQNRARAAIRIRHLPHFVGRSFGAQNPRDQRVQNLDPFGINRRHGVARGRWKERSDYE